MECGAGRDTQLLLAAAPGSVASTLSFCLLGDIAACSLGVLVSNKMSGVAGDIDGCDMQRMRRVLNVWIKVSRSFVHYKLREC